MSASFLWNRRFILIASFLVLLTSISIRFVYAAETGSVDTSLKMRREFHRKIQQVKSEMSEKEVLRILGKPDEVRTNDSTAFWQFSGDSSLWCYGVDEPRSLPTLGTINFDNKGKVNWVTVNPNYALPDTNVLSERELRDLLRIMHDYASQYGSTYGIGEFQFNPLPLIKTVNTLLPYGKKKVLLAMDEYAYLRGNGEELRALLLTLFDVPSDTGYLPRLGFEYYELNVSTPSDKTYVPRFPLVVIDDVPLSVFSNFSEGSLIHQWPPKPYPNIDWFKAEGKWRSKSLTPPNDPLGILEKFMASPEYLHLYEKKQPDGSVKVPERIEKRLRLDVQRQLLRLVNNAYPYQTEYEIEKGDPLRTLPPKDWERMRLEFSQTNAYWSMIRQNYLSRGLSAKQLAPFETKQ